MLRYVQSVEAVHRPPTLPLEATQTADADEVRRSLDATDLMAALRASVEKAKREGRSEEP
jgi:non-homologous end joining protein Ku